MKRARTSGDYALPAGSLKRVMEFSQRLPEFAPSQHRNLALNISSELSKSIGMAQVFLSGPLDKSYSTINAALSPDFLLRITYEGKGERIAEDAQQVTVSMQELGLQARPYWLVWDELESVKTQSANPANGTWPEQFQDSVTALENEAGNAFVADNPGLLGMVDPDGESHALIGFDEDEGAFFIATKHGESVIAYQETFDCFKPVVAQRKNNPRFDRLVGLESRLGLEVPHEIDGQAPSFHFVLNRGNELIKIESSNYADFSLALMDETGQQCVSPHFYYGITMGAAHCIWALNKDAETKFNGYLKEGFSHEESSNKTVEYLLSELKSRHGFEQTTMLLPTSDDGFDKQEQQAPKV